MALATGIGAMLVMANLDTLWRVAIKNNNDDEVRQQPTSSADFVRYDSNADGQVSLSELTDGAALKPEGLLARGDDNGDGQLSRTEFLRAERRRFDWPNARRDALRQLRGEPGLVRRGSRW